MIDRSRLYRLDTFVNRVPYDRMIEALQLFLSPINELPLSRAVRDLLLYSYPNSMIRLANSAGGLKMALPIIDMKQGGSNYSGRSVDTASTATAPAPTPAKSEKSLRARIVAEDDDTRWDVSSTSPSTQLNQQLSSSAPNPNPLFGPKQSSIGMFAAFDGRNTSAPVAAGRSLTVAEVLASARRKEIDFSQRFSTSTSTLRDDVSTIGVDPSSAVFSTNSRLQKMADGFTLNPSTGVIPFTPKEVAAVVARVGVANNLNPSQQQALTEAINRPLSLIQGPPGTGKTKTACSIIAAIVMLKEDRMREGGECLFVSRPHPGFPDPYLYFHRCSGPRPEIEQSPGMCPLQCGDRQPAGGPAGSGRARCANRPPH